MARSIFTRPFSCTSICSAKPPMRIPCATGFPPSRSREGSPFRLAGFAVHIWLRPETHASQCPQKTSALPTT